MRRRFRLRDRFLLSHLIVVVIGAVTILAAVGILRPEPSRRRWATPCRGWTT
jgi:hypothetical protein